MTTLEFLLDILERVNQDPELVTSIRSRADLQHPDLHVARLLAQKLVDEQ